MYVSIKKLLFNTKTQQNYINSNYGHNHTVQHVTHNLRIFKFLCSDSDGISVKLLCLKSLSLRTGENIFHKGVTTTPLALV